MKIEQCSKVKLTFKDVQPGQTFTLAEDLDSLLFLRLKPNFTAFCVVNLTMNTLRQMNDSTEVRLVDAKIVASSPR